MTSVDDFKKAPFEYQCDVVTSHAYYLMKRKQDNCKIFLYQTTAFFIEVYYSLEFKKVIMINAFDDGAGLLAYADHCRGIEIEE